MILVCPKCKASYEAILKDPSKPEPKGEVRIRCLACANPYLISQGSLKQELLKDLAESQERGGFPADPKASPSESRAQDSGGLDFPIFEEIEEPLEEVSTAHSEDRRMPSGVGSKYSPLFLIFLVLGVVIGVGLFYRFIWVSSDTETAGTPSLASQPLKPKAGVGGAQVPFSALSFEDVRVEKRKNRFDEAFILVRGRLKNIGTARVNDRLFVLARAYKEDGSLKESRSVIPGNDLSPSFAEQASVFELIANSELPASEAMPILLEPKESIPFGLVFPSTASPIHKIEITLRFGSR